MYSSNTLFCNLLASIVEMYKLLAGFNLPNYNLQVIVNTCNPVPYI